MKLIKGLTKFRPQNRTQLFLLYTLLFTVTSVIVYLPFLLSNTSLLWNDDGLLLISGMWRGSFYPRDIMVSGPGISGLAQTPLVQWFQWDTLALIPLVISSCYFQKMVYPPPILSKFSFSYIQPDWDSCTLER